MKKIFKRSLAVLLVVVMVVGAAPLSGLVGLDFSSIKDFFGVKAQAVEEITEGYYTYWIDYKYDKVIITDCDTSISGDVTIPSILNGYPVTSISTQAFFCCSNITSVTIPDSVTSIGVEAFCGCSKLTNIIFPNSLIGIGTRAFNMCYRLSNVTLPNALTSIGDGAFANCTDLRDAKIPNSVTKIGDSAFAGCESLSNITIPNSVKTMGDFVFSGCNNLTSITVDSKNLYFSSDNFGVLFNKDKTELIQYPIGNTRTSYAIPNNAISIRDYAFSKCESLINVTIPDSVTSIGNEAFSYCTNLVNVKIPEGVTEVNYCTFYSCTKLIGITIPKGVTSIDETAFYCCDSLTHINVDLENEYYSSDKYGVLYNKNKTELILYPMGSTSANYIIPDGVKTIFLHTTLPNCLEYVHIPQSVIRIDGLFISDNSNTYICANKESYYAKRYASDNAIEFEICDGHDGGESENPDKLELISTSPANGATSISYDDELVLTFNQNLHEELYILDPNSAIKICDYNTDAVIYSIDYNDYGITGFVDSPVVIEGNILTIRNALHKLVPGSKYYVTISPNIILSQPDSDGNRKSFAGITDKDTWTFSYLSPSVKERYSLDVYFTKPSVVLSAGKSASISAVLSFNGETTFPEMTFSVDDSTVAEITEIKTQSNICYATIKGKNQGSTTITVTANTIDGNIVKKFPVFVSDPETVYYCNYIDGRFNNNNPFYLSGMYIDTGMYIDDFKHTENDDGSVNAVFTVYNHEHCYGTVDIYDENGNLVDYEVIDMYTGEYQTDIFSHIGYTWKLTEGVVTGEMFDPDDYKSEVWCKKTDISIVVPQNGYYVISNNISTSKACLAYNISTLLVEMLLKNNDFIDKLSKKDLLSISANSEKIAKAFSEEFLSELIKNGSDKVTDDLIEALIEFSVESQAKSAAGVEKVFDSFEDCLNELGLNVFETVKKSIVKVLKTSITETALNVLFDLNLKRCGKDIVDMIYYNAVTISKWLTTAGSIQEHTDSSSVYVYNQQNNSMRKSNGIVSYTTENYDTVFHTVILKSGDKVDYVNRLTGEQEKAKVYDISLIRDGESVQPKDSVTVYIPIPNGWITDNLTLYHISKETGKREKIPVEIENGYAKFVTDSFSYFILSTDELKFVDTFEIKTPSTTTISYGDTLILHAVVESVPNGTNIAWEVSGNGVSIKPSEDGLSCAVTSTKTGTVSINAKLIDESGEVLKNFDSEELTASQSIKSNAGFFQKIIAFFKKLFGLTKTIPQIYNGIF